MNLFITLLLRHTLLASRRLTQPSSQQRHPVNHLHMFITRRSFSKSLARLTAFLISVQIWKLLSRDLVCDALCIYCVRSLSLMSIQ